MAKIGATDYLTADFDKNGAPTHADFGTAFSSFLSDKTDIFIVSHGWKTTNTEAFDCYRDLWIPLEGKITNPSRKWGVIGITWPSTKYRKETDQLVAPTQAELGALAIGDAGGIVQDLPDSELTIRIKAFCAFTGLAPQALLSTAGQMIQSGISPQTAASFIQVLDTQVKFSKAGDDELMRDAQAFIGSSPDALFYALMEPNYQTQTGGALGVGDAIKKGFSGIRNAIANVLDVTTYFEMKKRAGKVGTAFGAKYLQPQLSATRKLHLVGHSFGGRLVTAATSALNHGASIQNLVLMQAAFSHNGLTTAFKPGSNGAFANVVSQSKAKRIVVTHTHNDKACLIAYPLASRVSNDLASGFGDINDPFGAMGANGPRLLPATIHADVTADAQGNVGALAKLVVGVRSDQFVGGHTEVWTPRMANLLGKVIG